MNTNTIAEQTARAGAGLAAVWAFREKVGTAQKHRDLLAAEQAWRARAEADEAKPTVTHLAVAHERNDGIACEGWYYPRAYRHTSTAVYGDVTCPACISEVTFTMAAADPEHVYA